MAHLRARGAKRPREEAGPARGSRSRRRHPELGVLATSYSEGTVMSGQGGPKYRVEKNGWVPVASGQEDSPDSVCCLHTLNAASWKCARRPRSRR